MKVADREELEVAHRKFALKDYPRSVMTPDLITRLVDPKCVAFENILNWLSKQGFALVPLMPTDAMIKAGHEVPDEPECAEPASIFLSAANGAGNILTKTEDQ